MILCGLFSSCQDYVEKHFSSTHTEHTSSKCSQKKVCLGVLFSAEITNLNLNDLAVLPDIVCGLYFQPQAIMLTLKMVAGCVKHPKSHTFEVPSLQQKLVAYVGRRQQSCFILDQVLKQTFLSFIHLGIFLPLFQNIIDCVNRQCLKQTSKRRAGPKRRQVMSTAQ